MLQFCTVRIPVLDSIIVKMANKVTTKVAKRNTGQSWGSLTLLGIFIYVVIDVVLIFLRPDYNWLHNAESDYGRGPYFWLMDINFIVRCLLSLALAKAIFSRFPGVKSIRQAGAGLVVWAIASGLLAFFADNPYSYPKLASGKVHVLLAVIAFLAVIVAMIAFSRLAPLLELKPLAGKIVILLTGIAVISLLLLGHAGFRPHSFGGYTKGYS
ncbi:MAG: DUF998 domain-containing protein [Candidatus Saccharimonadales bacterium]